MKRRINIQLNQGLIIFAILITLISCDINEKFNSQLWKEKGVDWWMTDTREKMVEHLLQSDTLVGLKRINVVHLLGEPEKSDKQVIEYLVREKYETDIDPEYISYLIIELDVDERVKNCEIKNRNE